MPQDPNSQGNPPERKLTDAEQVVKRGFHQAVTHGLKSQLDGSCVIERVARSHFGGAFPNRQAARQYMIATEAERREADDA